MLKLLSLGKAYSLVRTKYCVYSAVLGKYKMRKQYLLHALGLKEKEDTKILLC